MTKCLIGLSSLLIICMNSAGKTQTPDTLWTKTFGGSDHDYGYDVKQTSDGGFIISGCTSSYGTGWWNLYLVKTDPDGDIIWTRYYSADGADIAYCVQQTNDGGYILACDEFIDLMKTDEYGDSVWTRDYGISPRSVWQTNDGGYIVGGSEGIEGYLQTCLVKTDPFGNSIWHHNYILGDPDDVSNITCLQQTADGGYIAAGHIYTGENWWDYLLIKTDASGDTVWTRRYGASFTPEEAYAMQQTSDGGYIITGLYFWTVKTDAAGDTLWTRYYGSGEIGCAFSIHQTYDHGYILCGYINPIEGSDESQLYVVKIDAQGEQIWERTYGTELGWDYGQSVRQTSDGGFIVTGWTDSFGAGGQDAWLLRIDSESQGIPTLSEWGMLIMGLLLVSVGTIAVVRRRKAVLDKAV